ncbi:hypothetical protein K469DRAFT_561972 [Zopfia rhizophila CBS 207.26]|uniref:Uncharacterized protein n=1 Tax=Zopfia rhizophila CBS 207.26 TaxID=1314779 RepID=A0A6A6EE66_9PEZI|nr:hypothetical protein K469DRAFT_561972 [Zopfia rhizophila CBS 207.26]
MFEFSKNDGPHPKCYFTHSLLPNYIDPNPNNISTKKKPFSTFNSQRFSHTVDLILPEEIYEIVRNELEADRLKLRYARVYLKLEELLKGDFFTEYIKKGNIMMVSDGRPLVDNVFSLYEGVLRLELDRPTYERCGLQGRPIEDGGRKHRRARYVVEFDLRQSSMMHGKNLFSRLEWACKKVLNHGLIWLFYNFNPSSPEALKEGREPISLHHPFVCSIPPNPTTLNEVLMPKLRVGELESLYEQEESTALLEWLHLVSVGSPRIQASDRIDAFLSRYEVPDFTDEGEGGPITKSLVRVRWKGFIPPQHVRDLFLMVKRNGLGGGNGEQDKENERWFALNVKAFGGYGGSYTVMQFAGRDTLTWECD